MERKLLLAAVVLAVSSPMALAQDDEMEMEMTGEEVEGVDMEESAFGPEAGDWELTLGGGGTTSQDIDTSDLDLNGSIGYYFTRNWEVAVRQDLRFTDTGSSILNGQTRVALDYNFDLGRFWPFVGASIGGIYGDDVADSGAAGLEGGLKYYARKKTFLFGRLEYQWFFDSGDAIDNSFDDGNFIYTIGIGFNF